MGEDKLATPAAVQAFIDLATADLVAHGRIATAAEIARRIGIKAADLSQARHGVKPISIERLIRWVKLWNGRPFLGGIADYESPIEIRIAVDNEEIRVFARSRSAVEAGNKES